MKCITFRWLVVTAIATLLSSTAWSQPVLKWDHQFNSGIGTSADSPGGLGVDSSGNVYEAVDTPGATGGLNIRLLKYNKQGVYQHVTVIKDGDAKVYVDGIAVDKATGDSYITGSTDSGPYIQTITVKISSSGAEIWRKLYSGPSTLDTAPNSIKIDGQGNLVICGSEKVTASKEGAFILKYKNNGDGLWAHHINTYPCFLFELAIGPADSINLAGYATPTTAQEILVAQFSSTGNLNWTLYYQSAFQLNDFGLCVAVDHSGNVFAGGSTQTSSTGHTIATLKISSGGIVQWATRSDAGTGGYVTAIAPDEAGGCFIVGLVSSTTTMQDGIAQKYDDSGAAKWSLQYDGPNSGDDIFSHVQVDPHGFPIISGDQAGIGTLRDQVLLKMNPTTGAIIWKETLDDVHHEDDLAPPMAITPEGDIYTESYIDYPDQDVIFARYQQTPRALGDQFDVVESNLSTFNASSGVLANDQYVKGGTAILVSQPTHGTVTLNSDGSFTYTSDNGYHGNDSFAYKASRDGVSSGNATAQIAVKALAPTSLTFNPPAVVAGSSTTGTVKLNGKAPAGGILVTLSSNSSVIHVPASISVPSGSSSAAFTAVTLAVSTTVVRTVTASRAGVSAIGSITIVPALALESLSISPSTIFGGSSTTGTVTMNAGAASNTTVTISDNSSAITTPASVVVPTGALSKSFTIQTAVVGTSATRTVSASYLAVTKNASLTLLPGGLSNLTLNPTTVKGGSPSVGTVTLSHPAPPGGILVALSDNSSALSVPSGVTVAAGATTATFTVTTYAVGAVATRTVSATLNGVTKSAAITLTP